MPFEAPLARHRETVRPEWIDYNGHMNVAYYLLVFDRATDAFFDAFDGGADYRRREDKSFFAVEAHMNWLAELHEGEEVRVETQILGFDAKRVRHFHRMVRARDGAAAATGEFMGIHIDMATRRSCPMGPDLVDRLAALVAAHQHLPPPPQAGRSIALGPRQG